MDSAFGALPDRESLDSDPTPQRWLRWWLQIRLFPLTSQLSGGANSDHGGCLRARRRFSPGGRLVLDFGIYHLTEQVRKKRRSGRGWRGGAGRFRHWRVRRGAANAASIPVERVRGAATFMPSENALAGPNRRNPFSMD